MLDKLIHHSTGLGIRSDRQQQLCGKTGICCGQLAQRFQLLLAEGLALVSAVGRQYLLRAKLLLPYSVCRCLLTAEIRLELPNIDLCCGKSL